MFDLEQAIADWRREMLAAGIKQPMPMEELESHLRDEIEQQAKLGLGREAAFRNAVQRLGRAQLVQNEFNKTKPSGPGAHRVRKLLDIVFAVWVFWISFKDVDDGLFEKGALTPGQQMWSLAGIATFTLLVLGGRLGYRVFPIILWWRIRNAMTLFDFALLTFYADLFCYTTLPKHDYTVGQCTVAFIWGLICLLVAWSGLCWANETVGRKRIVSAGT